MQLALCQETFGVGQIDFGALPVFCRRCKKRHMLVPPFPRHIVGALKQRIHAFEVAPNRLGEWQPRFLECVHHIHHLLLTPPLQG